MDFQILITIPTLGDFANGFPVYDALAKSHGKFPMILPNAMRMFAGIKEFVHYQGFTSSVLFQDEVQNAKNIIPQMELPASFFQSMYGKRDRSITRPFFTCHVEKYLKANLILDFEIDDAYQLKVKDVDVDPGDHIWAGDRWSQTLDHRRKHSFMGHLPGLKFLDYKQDIFTNLNIIQKSKYPFVSTFTGVSILADLIYKSNVVLYDTDMIGFMGWSPEFSFRKHYYTDRRSYIQYINDFNAGDIICNA